MMAALLGLFLPLLFVFIRGFFDPKIRNVEDIDRITPISLLGVIGRSHTKTNLAVIAEPKAPISESFRALRSSLQFIYKKQGIKGAKTLLITSSVGGEGKTFCSINLASVFALSEKKTVLVGLDLRKPKIFGDFKLDNSMGVVNYLTDEAPIDTIIQQTHLEFLDVIPSGPVPKNPAELLIGEKLEDLIKDLKQRYDYVILDTPPLGLVSDALELIKFVDAIFYIVRFNYTHRQMLNFVNEKFKTGEVKNISIVLNDYTEKSGRGYSYGYGYGYGYANYGKGYMEKVRKRGWLDRLKETFESSE